MSGLFSTPLPNAASPNLPAKKFRLWSGPFRVDFPSLVCVLVGPFFFRFARPNRFFLLTYFHKSRKFEAKVHLKATFSVKHD